MEDDWESNEEFYKNKILDEPWIKNNEYLNKMAFMENIPSYHYFHNQCNNLENHYQKKLSKNLFFNQIFQHNLTLRKYVVREYILIICMIY